MTQEVAEEFWDTVNDKKMVRAARGFGGESRRPMCSQ